MEIREIREGRKDYLDLLLLADEQEDMVDRYLESGEMFVLCDPEPVGECVILRLDAGTYEVKNLAVRPDRQKRGCGKALLDFAASRYPDCECLLVGTGDSPLTIPFYEACGFREHHRVKNFFTDNYDHPIYEAGVLLADMVYLAKYPKGEQA